MSIHVSLLKISKNSKASSQKRQWLLSVPHESVHNIFLWILSLHKHTMPLSITLLYLLFLPCISSVSSKYSDMCSWWNCEVIILNTIWDDDFISIFHQNNVDAIISWCIMIFNCENLHKNLENVICTTF